MPLRDAADKVKKMSGQHRIFTILKTVDRLSREEF
jgi:hypothetical protein